MVTTILDEMLKPATDNMPVAFAEKILGLRADEALFSKLDILRSKANLGTITSDEDTEYKEIVEAIDIISMLQLRAQQVIESE